ncbi:MAG: hypothetical protein KAR42_17485 [candidate division Zixibacteria bacterium]|nr:hypothetical protein [candidate division Zixibacteria bacterium]
MKIHGLRIKLRIILVSLFILCGVGLISGCGEREPEIDMSQYDSWLKYDYGHFSFRVSPTSEYAENISVLAKNYERFLKDLCAYLEMPVPEGKIRMYVYTAGNEDKTITGRQTPFSDDSTIHWGNKYPYGYELTKFLLRKRGFEPGQFNAINEGIPFLLDFSGLNYHDKTNRRVNSDLFFGVEALGDSQKFDSLDFVGRRAESASLCGFIMYNYGLDRLFMLAESSVEWRRSIETIFQLPLDEFEKSWIEFARENSNDPEGLVDDDPVKDMRIYRK